MCFIQDSVDMTSNHIYIENTHSHIMFLEFRRGKKDILHALILIKILPIFFLEKFYCIIFGL